MADAKTNANPHGPNTSQPGGVAGAPVHGQQGQTGGLKTEPKEQPTQADQKHN